MFLISLSFLNVFGHFQTCLNVFGRVWTRSDVFEWVWKRSDTLGYIPIENCTIQVPANIDLAETTFGTNYSEAPLNTVFI